MEEAYRAGNPRPRRQQLLSGPLYRSAEFCEVKPAVNQMEKTCTSSTSRSRYGGHEEVRHPPGILGALAEGRNGFFDNEVLKAVGAQQDGGPGRPPLPGPAGHHCHSQIHPPGERMVENFNIFDFELSSQDMKAIAALDRGESLFFPMKTPQRWNS